jgi:rare lipoprotein A
MRPSRRCSTLAGCVALAALFFQTTIVAAEVVASNPADAKPTKAKRRHKVATRPADTLDGRQDGNASFYSRHLSGRKTASGEKYDPTALTAAHRTLPLGTKVRVVNPKNDRSVVVTVNDRGPVPKNRVLDVSSAAADALGMKKDGVTKVETQVVGKDDLPKPGSGAGD